MNTPIEIAETILLSTPDLSTTDLVRELQARDVAYSVAMHAADIAKRRSREATQRHVAKANASQVQLGDEAMPAKHAGSAVLRRGANGLPEIDLGATAERIAREQGIDYASAQSEAVRLARSVSASSSTPKSAETFELTARLVKEGLTHGDAQNVVVTLRDGGSTLVDFDAKGYVAGRASGASHGRALSDSWKK
jgi:hypothetical protein